MTSKLTYEQAVATALMKVSRFQGLLMLAIGGKVDVSIAAERRLRVRAGLKP